MRRFDGLLLFLFFMFFVLLGLLSFYPFPVTANESGCSVVGEMEGEKLYFCETGYGIVCIWDPSPTLGAGVMNCE